MARQRIFDWYRWLYGTEVGPVPTRREAIFRACLRRHGWTAMPDWVVHAPGKESRQSQFILLVASNLSMLPDGVIRHMLPQGSVVVVTAFADCAVCYLPTELTGILVAGTAFETADELAGALRSRNVLSLPLVQISGKTPQPEHLQQLLDLRNAMRQPAQPAS